jgi:UDP-N-acetylmuramate-alanine ligase
MESYDFLGTQTVAHSPKINKVGVKTIIDFQGEEYPISIFGNHNISNLAVAREVCIKIGISASEFYQPIADFKGAAKRLELLYHNDELKVFLDFAHAPSKVAASVKAVQDWFKGSRISIFLELNTFSSLNPEFIVQYSNTIEEVENLFVFIHPDVQKQKVNYDLDEDFLRNAFNNPQLNFIQDSNILASKMTEIKANSDVILIMSSGNLGGIELGRIFVD